MLRPRSYPMLCTIAPHGMTFEVGAVACGCIDGALFQQSLTLLMHALDYVHAHNIAVAAGDSAAWRKTTVPAYDAVRTVDYPKYDANVTACPGVQALISATVHPAVRGKDFVPLRRGDPIFLTMEGETIGFEPADEDRNEAAVYPFLVDVRLRPQSTCALRARAPSALAPSQPSRRAVRAREARRARRAHRRPTGCCARARRRRPIMRRASRA